MTDAAPSAARPAISRLWAELATAAVLAAVGGAVVVGALEYQIGWDDAGPQPGYFPFFVGLLIITGSLGTAVQAWRGRHRHAEPFLDARQAGRVAAFFGPIVAFVAVTVVLGIYVATALYLVANMLLLGRYRLRVALPVGVGTAIAFFVLFEILFNQPLLKGPVEAWLGFY